MGKKVYFAKEVEIEKQKEIYLLQLLLRRLDLFTTILLLRNRFRTRSSFIVNIHPSHHIIKLLLGLVEELADKAEILGFGFGLASSSSTWRRRPNPSRILV